MVYHKRLRSLRTKSDMDYIGPCDLGNIRDFICEHISVEIIDEVENLHLVSGNENKFYEASQRAHPLSKALYIFDGESERSTKENRLNLSKDSYRIIQMYDDLLMLKDNPGLPRIISNINVSESFYSGLFELLVAASYCRIDYDIEILTETDNRTPDFKISSNRGCFYVECKSLENKLRNAEAVWERVSRRVNKIACELDWQLGIDVTAKDYITNRQADELIEYLKTSLIPPSKVTLDFDHSIVNVSFLAHFDDEQPFKEIQFSALDLARVECSLRRDGNIDYTSQISYVNVKSFFSGDYARQSRRLFKKANTQLPSNEFSVLHLEIPHGSQEEFISSIDAIYPSVYESLNRKNVNIDSVVISSLSKEPVEIDEHATLLQEHVIVPKLNFNAVRLQGMPLLGSNDTENILHGLKTNPSEGTIFFEFLLDQPIQARLGCYIFSAVSENGNHQVKVGFISENIIRVEVITPAIGRLMCNYISSNIIREKLTNKMAIVYEMHVVKVALNGVMLPISR